MNNKIIMPALGLLVLAAVLFFAAMGGFNGGPSDSEIKAHWNRRYLEYDRLAQMLAQDTKIEAMDANAVYSVAEEPVELAVAGISKERFAEYQLMIRKLEIKRIDRLLGGRLAFKIWVKGSHAKGLLWSDQPTLKGKPIQDKWYIYQK